MGADAHGAAARPVVAEARDAAASLQTVRDLVRHATSHLAAAGVALGHGTDDAYDEAVWLVCWSLRLPIERYADLAPASVAWPEARAVLALIARRCTERIPLAYLTGEAWLLGYQFRADRRALVPRSPIAEVLVHGLADAWLPPALRRADDEGDADLALPLAPPLATGAPAPATAGGRILDLCTGGGSLAIIAADCFPDAQVVGADISADALALAAENRTDHGLDDRLELVRGDLFRALGPIAPATDAERFDLIVCNPPYVNARSMARLPAEYLAEPQAALAGGADGMDLIARLLDDASGWLRPGGLLLLEIGHERRHFAARFPRLEWATVATAGGADRIVAIGAQALATQAAATSSRKRPPRSASAKTTTTDGRSATKPGRGTAAKRSVRP